MENGFELANINQSNERGAALVTVLLTSMILLGLGLTLILSTSQETTNTISLTSEMQAYYAAEAGLEASLNVLRGNVPPAASLAGTKMNFANAVTLSTSNLAGDVSTRPRLSGWLSYSGNSVPIGATGLSYSVTLKDPDGTSPLKPVRLIIQSTGYGPNGSIKKMQMMVNKASFDYSAVSTILIRGATNTPTPSQISFDAGPSNAKTLTGHDQASSSILPTVGYTNPTDSGDISGLDKGSIGSPPQQLIPGTSLPSWLQTPAAARSALSQLAGIARSAGRYFGTGPASTVDWSSIPGGTGTAAAPLVTFVDGSTDVGTGFVGAGLLVITGNLAAHGNTSFDGLVLVLGTGTSDRQGGGNGTIQGAMVYATFSPTAPASGPDTFGAPSFATSGGGDSSILYDSSWVIKALNLIPPTPIAVAEQ